MDFKVRGYQSFCGEFVQTNVKISQKIVDRMGDADLMELRSLCSIFEARIFHLLSFYAQAIRLDEREENYAETSPETDEETNPETYAETNPEANPETIIKGAIALRTKKKSPISESEIISGDTSQDQTRTRGGCE